MKQNTTAKSKNEPIKENTSGSSGNANQKDGGFIAMLINEVKDLLRNPKKLLPTIILSIVWMLFSIMSAMGANIPILRFLYTLTYSNGGMFGGFFGAVGGIFGKAVFAAVVNTLVLSLVAKKNPFANAMPAARMIAPIRKSSHPNRTKVRGRPSAKPAEKPVIKRLTVTCDGNLPFVSFPATV